MKVSRNTFWLLLILAFSVLAMAIYWPARNGAWVLDDITNIATDIRLRDFSDSIRLLMKSRGISFLSFALDLKWWGLDPSALRWINVLIHVMNSLLVVLLLRQLTGSDWRWAIVGGLFFLCHPVQTSAVSYIVQRMTLLSTFFALAAILLADRYFILVEEGRGTEARKFLFISVFCGIFSVMSKENTVLLPLIIPLLAWFRGRGCGRLAVGWRSAFTWWLTICVVAIIYQYLASGTTVGQLSDFPLYKDTGKALYEVLGVQERAFLPLRYFLSQLEVFWVYLGLIFFPLNQALDYTWPIPDLRLSFLHFGTLTLIIATLWFTYKRRDRYPLFFFGMAWILIFTVVESSFIPLDPIFEHRLYLLLIGVIIIFHDFGELLPKKIGLIIAVAAICLLAFLSWKRNQLWGDPVSFWQSNLRVAERAPRPLSKLAVALFSKKRFSEATEEVIRLKSQNFVSNMTVGEALYFSGKTDEAMAVFRSAAQNTEPGANGLELFTGYRAIQEKRYAEATDWLNRAELRFGENVTSLYFRGVLAEAQNDKIGAVEYYLKAIKESESSAMLVSWTFSEGYALWARERRTLLLAQLSEWLDRERGKVRSAPKDIKILGNFAALLTQLGLYSEALEHYETIKKLAPNAWSLNYSLATVYEELGRFGDAERNYKICHESSPNNPEISFSYATILAMRGKLSAAHEVLAPLLQQYPSDARFLLLSGDVLRAKGEFNMARDAYLRAYLLPGYQSLALSRLMLLKK